MEYNKKVMQCFKHPKNVGKIERADGIGVVGNMTCGDVMKIYIKIGRNKKGQDFIKDIKFQTLGCVAAIATSSAVTQLAKNKTLDKAIKVTNKDVIRKLGGLPPVKHHCSLLAEEAIGEAIYNYLKKNKKPVPRILAKKHIKALKAEKAFHAKFKEK